MLALFCRFSIIVLALLPAAFAAAADWPQFRGPNRDGGNADAGTSTTLDSSSVVWKQKLPGHGSSSPITWEGKVFLTCYSGYGFDERDPGEQSALVRHVLAFDLKSGKPLWDLPAKASLPEQDFRGFQALHGYASSTPSTDGTLLYVFLG